nr:MAG TPA: hypothetical protein [Caudoviricetes sp.]
MIGGHSPAFVWRSAIASACRTYSFLILQSSFIHPYFPLGILIRNLLKKLSY